MLDCQRLFSRFKSLYSVGFLIVEKPFKGKIMIEDAEGLLEVVEEIYTQLKEDVKEDADNEELQELLSLFERVHNGTKDEKSKQLFSDIVQVMSFLEAEDEE